MGGSEDRPVSRAWMWPVRSWKHSSRSSKPDLDPKRENQGVQIWAGMRKAFSLASRAISNKSLESSPRIGLPSEVILPIRSSLSLNLRTDAMSGIRIR